MMDVPWITLILRGTIKSRLYRTSGIFPFKRDFGEVCA